MVPHFRTMEDYVIVTHGDKFFRHNQGKNNENLQIMKHTFLHLKKHTETQKHKNWHIGLSETESGKKSNHWLYEAESLGKTVSFISHHEIIFIFRFVCHF